MKQRLPAQRLGQVDAQTRRRPDGKTRERRRLSLESDALAFALLLLVLFVAAGFVVYWAGSWGDGERMLSRPISQLRGAGGAGGG